MSTFSQILFLWSKLSKTIPNLVLKQVLWDLQTRYKGLPDSSCIFSRPLSLHINKPHLTCKLDSITYLWSVFCFPGENGKVVLQLVLGIFHQLSYSISVDRFCLDDLIANEEALFNKLKGNSASVEYFQNCQLCQVKPMLFYCQ